MKPLLACNRTIFPPAKLLKGDLTHYDISMFFLNSFCFKAPVYRSWDFYFMYNIWQNSNPSCFDRSPVRLRTACGIMQCCGAGPILADYGLQAWKYTSPAPSLVSKCCSLFSIFLRLGSLTSLSSESHFRFRNADSFLDLQIVTLVEQYLAFW